MSALSDQMRARATEFRDGAATLLTDENKSKLAADIHQQIAAIVGKVGALTLDAMADVIESGGAIAVLDAKTQRRKMILEKNDAIRRAAAAGKWDEVERLAAGFDPGTGASAGTATG